MVNLVETLFLILLVTIPALALIVFGVEFSTNLLVLSSFFYWWYLMVLFYLVLKYKHKSVFFLKTAIIIFSVGALFKVINLEAYSETLMRLTFVHLLVGLIQKLLEYKHED